MSSTSFFKPAMQFPQVLKPENAGLPKPDFIGGLNRIEACPKKAGLYALWLYLGKACAIERPVKAILPAGWYCYLGSAYGPGGLRARLHRHFRQDKTIRWHIDQLSMKADDAFAWGWIEDKGARECLLVEQLQKGQRQKGLDLRTPVPGFGSSDCRQCKAHLLCVVTPAPADDGALAASPLR